jgi:hypothetical protein
MNKLFIKCKKGFVCKTLHTIWKKGVEYEVDWYDDNTITLLNSNIRWYHFRLTDKRSQYLDAKIYFDLTPIHIQNQLYEIEKEIGLK